MQTYAVKFKSFKSVIRPKPLEKNPKINKRRAMFIPDSRVVFCRNNSWIMENMDKGLTADSLPKIGPDFSNKGVQKL